MMPKTQTQTDRKAAASLIVRGLIGASLIVGGLVAACAPVIDNRGYVFNERLLEQLQKGHTSADAVIDMMGSPSTISRFNGGAYYYIHSRFVTESYRAPEEIERKVLAIYFDPEQKIRDLAVYRLEDGIIVPIVERTTRTQGQELSFLEQIFGNLGRFGDAAPGTEF